MIIGTIHAYNSNMKRIVLPVFNNRIAPLFDVACSFAFFETGNRSIQRQDMLTIVANSPTEKICELHALGIDLIICSAISRYLMDIINAKGIELMPGIIGDITEVVQAFVTNTLNIERFAMPGCKWGKRTPGCKYGRCPRYSEIRDIYEQ